MKPNKIFLIILSGLLFSFFTGCGYTVVKKSSKSSEYTNTQQNYSYTLSGGWTKRVGVGNAKYIDYYLKVLYFTLKAKLSCCPSHPRKPRPPGAPAPFAQSHASGPHAPARPSLRSMSSTNTMR